MKYSVTLGLETVTVEALSSTEAIRKARVALCEEWPRLWDVIMAKPEEAFKCEHHIESDM